MGEASKLLAQLVDVPPLHSLTQFAALGFCLFDFVF